MTKETTGKVQASAIGQIIGQMEKRGMFRELARRPRPDYDLMASLELVEAIGQRRNPRFEIDEENRFAYANFIRWCHCDPAMNAIDPDTGKPVKGDFRRGIYIAGNTGTGKSWCLDIMQMYCRLWGFKIAFPYEQTDDVLSWAGVRADAICDAYTRQRAPGKPLHGQPRRRHAAAHRVQGRPCRPADADNVKLETGRAKAPRPLRRPRGEPAARNVQLFRDKRQGQAKTLIKQ